MSNNKISQDFKWLCYIIWEKERTIKPKKKQTVFTFDKDVFVITSAIV